jgi:hypothetical protein
MLPAKSGKKILLMHLEMTWLSKDGKCYYLEIFSAILQAA